MNKRIFSLVCIVLYSLLAVSVHCSEQKGSGLGNQIFRAIKKIYNTNEHNSVVSKPETQLNNSNNIDTKDTKDNKDNKDNKRSFYEDTENDFWFRMNLAFSD
ncbi:hypothetical protein YYC_05333 [Plasmodium yoelii 17X]|uniref:Fam-c protein n=4 Tax=Plasmodium yoelii TaxID=5861 RepID=A0AAE9WQH1_PLAYO|nr:fam-c protein [Plasmodium yoelii]EAA18509.1 hypothetical protein [Plasmodium yoelii yoelii]ETB56986.1 hypothetical protein YYC_05333 [Plasmodium yoelii 17X]WBY58383.1 fam-c protein [Plasmodium yoelii yoelii]CDU18713.1 fam-c protein [Plasmodium yoelii]VTZ79298.1 fam-c protein [Plasmodium yoelii]|eukprot:XP_726944.1 fam-c protein [Plasmodium yoelii]